MSDRQYALLYLIHLLVYSDGEYDESEKDAVLKICDQEGVSHSDYQQFFLETLELTEREIFERGMEHVEASSAEDQLAVFVWLYKLSEADGMVHAKEVRFLLYSLRRTNLDLDDIKAAAKKVTSTL